MQEVINIRRKQKVKHIKTLNTKRFTEHNEKKVDVANVRHPASLLARLLVQ